MPRFPSPAGSVFLMYMTHMAVRAPGNPDLAITTHQRGDKFHPKRFLLAPCLACPCSALSCSSAAARLPDPEGFSPPSPSPEARTWLFWAAPGAVSNSDQASNVVAQNINCACPPRVAFHPNPDSG